MRNAEFGTGNGEGEMADDKWRMADDKWRMADDKWRMADGKCRDEAGHRRFPGARKWLPLPHSAMSRGPDGGKTP